MNVSVTVALWNPAFAFGIFKNRMNFNNVIQQLLLWKKHYSWRQEEELKNLWNAIKEFCLSSYQTEIVIS